MALTETPEVEKNGDPAPPPTTLQPEKSFKDRLKKFIIPLILLLVGGVALWSTNSTTRVPAASNSPGVQFSGKVSPLPGAPVAAFSTSRIRDLVADPDVPQTLYAATSGGIKRSTDGGLNWSELEGGEVKGVSITSLALDSEDPERPLYASVSGNGVYKSVDDGKSWINLGLQNRSISAMAARSGILYVAVTSPFPGIYHSSDGGKTFAPAATGSLPPVLNILTIAIDPSNPANVYIGTAYIDEPRTPDFGRVKISRDTGRTWTNLGNWEANLDKGLDPRRNFNVLLQAPGNRIYAGDGEHLFRLSPDRSEWQPVGSVLPSGVFGLASDPQIPGIVYAAAKEGFYRNTGGSDWTRLNELKASPIFGPASSGAVNSFPALVAVNTHSNAVSTSGLNTTLLYALDPQGQLGQYENRDFGKTVVAPVPGFKEPDFSAYNGVNPAAPLDPPVGEAANEPGKSYFPETRHNLSGGFKTFWDKNGGVAAFGYPITEEFSEFLVTQNLTRTVQYFERVRLEYDPTAKPGQEVSVGLLGKEAATLKYYVPGRFIANTSLQAYFPETKHTLRGLFYQFWNRNSGLARFGYPLSEELDEKSSIDGKTLTVQYFERVKLEINKETRQVQIANLGREILTRRGWLK